MAQNGLTAILIATSVRLPSASPRLASEPGTGSCSSVKTASRWRRCCWRRAGSMPGPSSPIQDYRRASSTRSAITAARRGFFTCAVSKEAAAHAARYGAEILSFGPLSDIGVGPLNEAAAAEPVEFDPARQVAVLIYTSGTTGKPKGVMLSHRNLLVSAGTTALFRRMTEQDKVYVVLPISHIVGISLLIMTLMVGGSVRLVSKYDPAALAKAMAEEGITILNGVPATYQRLLEYKTVSGMKRLERGALRYMGVAGAPLDLELKARAENEIGLPLSNAYGITECSPGISGVRLDAPRSDEAVGTLVPGVEARVRTLDGIPVGNGEIGELHVRGPNVMLGYYREPALTANVIDSEGWFNTGDLARFEGDVSLYRRSHQGDDHPLGLQRLSRGNRGCAEFTQGRRSVGSGWTQGRGQRGSHSLCATDLGLAHRYDGVDELRCASAHRLQAAVANHRARCFAGNVDRQDSQTQSRGEPEGACCRQLADEPSRSEHRRPPPRWAMPIRPRASATSVSRRRLRRASKDRDVPPGLDVW